MIFECTSFETRHILNSYSCATQLSYNIYRITEKVNPIQAAVSKNNKPFVSNSDSAFFSYFFILQFCGIYYINFQENLKRKDKKAKLHSQVCIIELSIIFLYTKTLAFLYLLYIYSLSFIDKRYICYS